MLIYLLPFLIATFFSILYSLNIFKNNTIFYGIALFSLSIFSGFRFEVGPTDWMAYRQFFEVLNLDENVLGLYRSQNQQFEIGYYGLNYLIKYFGGSYGTVFFMASLFLSYSLYKFTCYFLVNKFYILIVYIGYSFILLNFAQVRQSIAVSFFLLGCHYYLCHRGKFLTLVIASLGLFFQYSAIIYIVVLTITLWFQPGRRGLIGGLIVISIAVLVATLFTNFYSFIQFIPVAGISEKIEIYQDNLSVQGFGQLILAGYFSLLTLYLIYNLTVVNAEEKVIVYYSIYITFVACLTVLVFPGTYAFFSRALMVAAIFQAYSFALIMGHKKSSINDLIFILTVAISFAYLYRLIYLYEDQFIPYKFNFAL